MKTKENIDKHFHIVDLNNLNDIHDQIIKIFYDKKINIYIALGVLGMVKDSILCDYYGKN